MVDDLLVRLFKSSISLGNPPDELSKEFGKGSEDCDPVICLGWSVTNREKFYGYTDKKFDEIWEIFNGYWNSVDALKV
jgi:hypothetical protein